MMWLLLILLFVLLLLAGGAVVLSALFHVLAFIGPLPLLIGVFGFWLLLHHHDPERRPRWERRPHSHTWDTPPTPEAAPPARARETRTLGSRHSGWGWPPRAASPSKPRLPLDVKTRVEQIRHKADVLLRHADQFPPLSRDLYLVRQITADYLPRTLDAYLSVDPRRTDRPVAGTDKTALQELKEQLSLLEAKLDEIAQDLERRDDDRLLANRRFLEQRFLLGEGEGEGPASASASASLEAPTGANRKA